MQHMLRSNVALLTTRSTKDEGSVFCTDTPARHKSASRYDITYAFPLYVYSGRAEENAAGTQISGVTENLSATFRAFMDGQFSQHYTPEEIFGYIYAVLYAPRYRLRYAESLRKDFARVPFPNAAEDFETLSGFGWTLVQAHLLRELPRHGLAVYHGRGDHSVETVRYSPQEQAIWINKTQCFAPVPEPVWSFLIGGYQVLDKYLKSRKGRTLSLDEINHIGAVADSLAFTIDQMGRIDEAYRTAFPDGG